MTTSYVRVLSFLSLPVGAALTLGAGTSEAQRSFTVRLKDQVISTERVLRVGDTVSVETTMMGSPVVFRSRVELSGERIQTFDGEVVTPTATQRAHVSIDRDSATLTWTSGAAGDKSMKLPAGRETPVMVFQNFVFAMMEPVLAPLASASRLPSHVRVIMPANGISQLWLVERDSSGAIVLVVPDGPRMLIRFAGGKLIGLDVPSQGVVMRADSTP